MGSSEPVKLRGHHLRSILDFYTKNSAVKYTPNLRKVKSVLDELLQNLEQKVTIVSDEEDVICAVCNSKKPDCFKEKTNPWGDKYPSFFPWLPYTDSEIAQGFFFETGQTYTVKQIRDSLNKYKDSFALGRYGDLEFPASVVRP